MKVDTRARVASIAPVLAAWFVLGVSGCAASVGDAPSGARLRCGPGTVEQDGFCVAWSDGNEPEGDSAAETPAADEPVAGGEPAGAADPAALEECGSCNTDGDCSERCPGTHCVRVNGERGCVADSPSDPAQAPAADDAACADPCDLYAQCGCQAGEGCAVDGAGGLECVETGSARQGDSCAIERCAAGYFCLSDDTCAAYCDDVHPCPAGSACIMELQDAQGSPLATLCWGRAGCDLLAQDCPAGQACALVDGDPGAECFAPGDAPIGGACAYADDCEAGSSCVQFLDEATSRCRQHCDVTAQAPCPAGLECFGLDRGDAGVCAPAA